MMMKSGYAGNLMLNNKRDDSRPHSDIGEAIDYD